MKTQIHIRHLTFMFCFVLALTVPLSIQAVSGTNEATASVPANEQYPLEQPSTTGEPLAVFSYQIEGRLDPFSPFISEKAASSINLDEIIDDKEALTGMQLFEPGQLKLVAIVFEDKAELAMVEDAAGQGYAIRPGMKIGKKGIITTIDPNQVIIEETSVTRAGKKLTNNIVMLLKKEGEE